MKDLSIMTDSELESYLYMCENNEHIYSKKQHATKILLNSLYGCLGTKYFRMFDVFQAEGITLSGQVVVTKSYDVMNDFINGALKTNGDYVCASDTDSVVGSSIININGKDLTIADYFDSLSGVVEYNKDQFVKTGTGYTLTYNGAIVKRNVKYAMKHKVKKKLYKISCGESFVIVTEDHSVKAIDEYDQLVDVKPQNLTKNHKLINISSDTDSIGDINETRCKKI